MKPAGAVRVVSGARHDTPVDVNENVNTGG